LIIKIETHGRGNPSRLPNIAYDNQNRHKY
jgi:hypothetical protein